MHPAPVFQVFGLAHLVAILITISVPIGLGMLVRLTNSRTLDWLVAIGFTLLLLTNYLGYALYLWQHDLLYWKQALPFQLCDWAMVTIMVALLTGWRGWTRPSSGGSTGRTW